MKEKIKIKSSGDLAVMKEGGRRLAKVKNRLKSEVKEGLKGTQLEALAVELIQKEGGEASFKKVPGYAWATCINVNEGVVHGIPKEAVFKKGDVVSVDIGLFFKGFHTDTAFTLELGSNKEEGFLEAGRRALAKAIESCLAGRRVFDISGAIESEIEKAGFSPVKALVGHGVGRALHEPPPIPCFTSGEPKLTPLIPEGAVFAIEVMYTKEETKLVLENDGWTISTKNGKIASLFEETVAISADGPLVLT